MFPHTSLYVGEFNCQHVNWGFNKTPLTVRAWTPAQHSTILDCCTTQRKQPVFFSHRWHVGTNLDLAFANFCEDSRLPNRRVLKKFLRPQHRHSFITAARLKVPVHRDPVKRWNFREGVWKRFCLLAGESVERLPPSYKTNIERVYQGFCESLLSAAKNLFRVAVVRIMCHVGTNSARPSIAPLSEFQWGLTLE